MTTPYWPDACRHNRLRDEFLGSFSIDTMVYDVFVYQDNTLSETPEMHVCIRYGAADEAYLSPGRVEDFIRRVKAGSTYEPYRRALPLVEAWQKANGHG